MQSLKGFPCSIQKALNAASPWEGIFTRVQPCILQWCQIKRPCKGGSPAPGSLWNLTLFSRLPELFSWCSPKWFLALPKSILASPWSLDISEFAPWTKISLDVYKWWISVLKCRAKRREKFLWYKTLWFYGTPYAPCSLLPGHFCILLLAPWLF